MKSQFLLKKCALKRSQFSNISIPKRRFFAQTYCFVGSVSYLPNISMQIAHEVLCQSAFQLRQQGVKVAVRVEDDNGFEIQALLFPGNDFK